MNKYIEIIKEENPHLIIDKFCFNKEGQNNDVVIINDDFIFKFPKYPQGIEKLKKEVRILNILKSYISLNIPNPIYNNLDSYEVGCVYSGYKMIRGISFKKDIFYNTQRKDFIAKQLALFLKELHSIPLEKICEYELDVIDGYNEWVSLFKKIKKKLFPFMKKESQDSISENFNDFFEKNYNFNKTLIHGDFGPSNIIFDSNSQTISGIIDFNDVSIGDPAIDIASLIGPFGYGEDFVKSFKPIYPNVEELLYRARFYASTFALQEALFGIEVGDKEAFDAGMKQYI
ncbi:aminoglycoside phosphotransferase family protein [Abyssisolibacter fermentans]|uniref:aminoglycoside phosphotransferase family protein n=1 Tax=Abyssisolibacter fermentans TaxID=1766203 RepID=UPI000834011A|nr:aminoglycoside phosphotransferase family protein [Abyssisolibacter fermentans]